MKKYSIFILTLLLISVLTVVVAADDLIGGEFILEADHYETDEDKHPQFGSKLKLELEKIGWTTGFHVGMTASSQFEGDMLDFELNEAYFDYYGDNYDFRLGKQLVSWGTAVEFNPTDNLNPVDPGDFAGDKRPVVMAQGNYYPGNNYQLTAIVIPYHEPVTDKVDFGEMEFEASPVEDNFASTEYGVKFSGRGINGFDYSLSYFTVFEDIPTVKIIQTPQGPAPGEIYYRPYNVIGADLATSYEGIGLWAEGAYFIPGTGEEYLSMVVGADYKFANNFYLEGQLIYQENQFNMENKLIQTAVERPFAGIHNFRLASVYNLDTEGYMIKPEVEFSLADATLLTASYQYNEGELLQGGMINNDSRLNLSLAYSF